MNRYVALDTTQPWGSVALIEAPVGTAPYVLAECGWQLDGSHAAHSIPMLDQLMQRIGWNKSQIDGYAACRGPGSFTGARVGLGTIKGLALASGRPAYGIDRLQAMAAAMGPMKYPRVPVLQAGRGEVYAAIYDTSHWPPKPLEKPWLGEPDSVLSKADGLHCFFGSGTLLFPPDFDWNAHGMLLQAADTLAGVIGRLAAEAVLQGVEPGTGMTPLYLRRPDAELNPRTPKLG